MSGENRKTHLIFLLDSSKTVTPLLPSLPSALEQIERVLAVQGFAQVAKDQGYDQGQGQGQECPDQGQGQGQEGQLQEQSQGQGQGQLSQGQGQGQLSQGQGQGQLSQGQGQQTQVEGDGQGQIQGLREDSYCPTQVQGELQGDVREGDDGNQGYEISIVSYKDDNNLLRCCWQQQNLSEINQFLMSLSPDNEQQVCVEKSPFIESNQDVNQPAKLSQQSSERSDSVNRSTSFKESLAKFQRQCTITENNAKNSNNNKNQQVLINSSISDKTKNNDCVYLNENFYIGSGSGSAEVPSKLLNNSSQLVGSGEGGDWQSGVGSLPLPSSSNSSNTEEFQQIGRCQKTAFNEIFRKCCKGDDQVIIFHYTDSAPHALLGNYGVEKLKTNRELSYKGMLEKNMLEGRKPGFDWVKICRQFRSTHVQVFTFIPASANNNIQYLNQFHLMLGTVVRLPSSYPAAITQSTMSIFLKLMGQQLLSDNYNFHTKNISKNDFGENSNILQFSSKSISKLSKLKNEGNCCGWLTPHGNLRCSVNSKGHVNIVKALKIDLFNLIQNFQFQNNNNVVQNMEQYFKKLFEQKNISPIIYNPIFLNLFLQFQNYKQTLDKKQKVVKNIDTFFEGYLSEEIRQIFSSQKQQWDQINQTHTKLKFECPFKPNPKCVYPDFKIQCTRCAQFRSFTLMQDGKCGMCRNFENNNSLDELNGEVSQKEQEQIVFLEEPQDVDENSSYLRECVDCHGIYATVKEVNCVFKCHYCRSGCGPPPLLKCHQCQSSYIVPDGLQSRPSPFSCPTCFLQSQKQQQIIKTNLTALTKQNPILPYYFIDFESIENIENRKFISDILNLYQIIIIENNKKQNNKFVSNLDMNFQLQFNGKQILQQSDLIKQIRQIMEQYNSLEMCHLCCEEFKVNDLNRACGKCNNKICRSCQQNWYTESQPGKLILQSKLSCPFCRQIPKNKILREYNKQALRIIRFFHKNSQIQREGPSSSNSDFRDDMYYGWCQSCKKVKEAMQRTCAGDKLPVLKGFCCEHCQVDEVINLGDVKRCPGCDAPSWRLTGCAHIECTICGTHWCYICQESFPDVYEHMDTAHDEAEAYPDDYNEDYDDEE